MMPDISSTLALTLPFPLPQGVTGTNAATSQGLGLVASGTVFLPPVVGTAATAEEE